MFWRSNFSSHLERLRQDAAYAVRTFARTPVFTLAVIATLGLGIGVTTAMFSMVDALLLNPLPYRDAKRLVVIWEKPLNDPKQPPVFDSYRDFEAWNRQSQSFEKLVPATWANRRRDHDWRGRFWPCLSVSTSSGCWEWHRKSDARFNRTT